MSIDYMSEADRQAFNRSGAAKALVEWWKQKYVRYQLGMLDGEDAALVAALLTYVEAKKAFEAAAEPKP